MCYDCSRFSTIPFYWRKINQLLIFEFLDSLCKHQSFSVVRLRNPRTLCGSLYAFTPKDSGVFEVNQFSEDKRLLKNFQMHTHTEIRIITSNYYFFNHRSWFLDNSVQSDGTLYLTTRVDPLFLILPFIVKAKHTSPLDQILTDEEYPDIGRLESCIKSKSVENIADMKTAGSYEVWRYNENKTLEWLGKKVTKLSNHLRERRFNVQQTSVSANYIKSCDSEVPESRVYTMNWREIAELFSQIFFQALIWGMHTAWSLNTCQKNYVCFWKSIWTYLPWPIVLTRRVKNHLPNARKWVPNPWKTTARINHWIVPLK